MNDRNIEIHLVSARELGQSSNPLLTGFISIYMDSFPEPAERESPSEWTGRALAEPPAPQPKTFIFVIGKDLESAQPIVYGGAVAEFYRRSECALLSYVAIGRDYRGRGYSNRLLAFVQNEISREAKRCGKTLKALFAECHPPTNGGPDSMSPTARLKIFTSLGFRWLDLPYLQPKLNGGSTARVSNLLLLAKPHHAESAQAISASLLNLYLTEFYDALEPEWRTDQDAALREALAAALSRRPHPPSHTPAPLDGIPLKAPPIMEEPVFDFSSGCAFTLHFVQRSYRSAMPSASTATPHACPFFSSFELDLLAYKFQLTPPFVSKCVELDSSVAPPSSVWIHFPPSVIYTTEGRTTTLYCNESVKQFRILLSQTFFRESGITVHHLSFVPEEDTAFTEYDIIKLTCLYGGIQENVNLRNQIKFSFSKSPAASKDALSIKQLIALLTRQTFALDNLQPQAGTIQIDLAACRLPVWPDDRLRKPFDTASPEERMNCFSELFEQARPLPHSRCLMALTGIITGIFDFERMSFAEFRDTFEPTVMRDGTFIKVHRATLVSLRFGDELLERCRDKCGASPYVLLPHALILHNSEILDWSYALQGQILRTTAEHSDRKQVVSKFNDLLIQHRKLERLLSYLTPNVFQYDTERALVARGFDAKGMSLFEQQTLSRQNEINSIIATLRTFREQRSQSWFALFGFVLTLCSTQAMIFAFSDDAYTRFAANYHRVTWLVFVGLVAGLCALVYYVSIRKSHRLFNLDPE